MHAQGDSTRAVALIQSAIAANPAEASFHNNLGNVLLSLHRLQEAESAYRRALTIRPQERDFIFNLANVLRELGQLAEAESFYRQALLRDSQFADGYNNLGITLQMAGKPTEAMAAYRDALAQEPRRADILNNLGNALQEEESFDEAIHCYQRAIAILPNYAEAHYNLGNAQLRVGRFEDAVGSYLNALGIDPRAPQTYCNLGSCLQQLGQFEDAVRCFETAIKLNPKLLQAHLNLGSALHERGRLGAATACFLQAIDLDASSAEAHYNLGVALQDAARFREAIESYQRTLKLKANFTQALSNLLYLHATIRDISPEEERDLAAKWEIAALDETTRRAARDHKFKRAARDGRSLKLGIVSAEIGEHAVADFLEPLLARMNRQRLHVTIFPTKLWTGERAKRMQALADDWVPLAGYSDAKAASVVRAHEIDILLDTTGHTRNCRLGIAARRVAPVQLCYIGYWSTTGLTEMDWVLADPDFPTALENHYREGVWRLPRLAVCYRGDRDLPESTWRPSEDGTIWLGSFNRYIKVQKETLELWAEVMRRLPSTKLLLEDRHPEESEAHERIRSAMREMDIAGERIEFEPFAPGHVRHMQLYDRIDIALDTLPLNSGTTACDALWMGVPLVAMEGMWSGGRIASSFLRALGKSGWIAGNAEEYLGIVRALAEDVALRMRLRGGLRNEMAVSPLCDAAGLTRALEDAFKQMFERAMQQGRA